jgi:hypothetical protein
VNGHDEGETSPVGYGRELYDCRLSSGSVAVQCHAAVIKAAFIYPLFPFKIRSTVSLLQTSDRMERDRELSKAVCVAVVQHMQSHPNWANTIVDVLTVDMKKLRSWLHENTGITDATLLGSAMGYNNFCMDVVTATRSSQ